MKIKVIHHQQSSSTESLKKIIQEKKNNARWKSGFTQRGKSHC